MLQGSCANHTCTNQHVLQNSRSCTRQGRKGRLRLQRITSSQITPWDSTITTTLGRYHPQTPRLGPGGGQHAFLSHHVVAPQLPQSSSARIAARQHVLVLRWLLQSYNARLHGRRRSRHSPATQSAARSAARGSLVCGRSSRTQVAGQSLRPVAPSRRQLHPRAAVDLAAQLRRRVRYARSCSCRAAAAAQSRRHRRRCPAHACLLQQAWLGPCTPTLLPCCD